jgi:phosphoserine phosphatase
MKFVATLVCNPANPVLTDALVWHVKQALDTSAVSSGSIQWLKPAVAVDIIMDRDAASLANMKEIADKALAGEPVDIIIQPLQGRKKHLFLADMDSTMIGQECIDELADMVGLKAHVSAITERAMRGELEFEPALRERVALLKGLDAGIISQIIASKITLTPGGSELVRTMRANGAYTALVSGGFTVFTSPISQMIGFDEHRSNTLMMRGTQLSGEVSSPILGKEAKRASLIQMREAHGLAHSDTMAVGDGANDLDMLGEAGLGLAFRAKPAVAAAAHARIDHADLTALLYAQGYKEGEIVRL